jgi:hypothetical protein
MNFNALCDKNVSFYGKVSLEKRCKFQKIFGNLKLQHISRYIDTLKKFGVALSPNMMAGHLAPKTAIDQAKAVKTIDKINPAVNTVDLLPAVSSEKRANALMTSLLLLSPLLPQR